MNIRLISYITAALVTATFSTASQAEKQLIAGAGPSTKVVQLFVEKFASEPAATGYQFDVPSRSAKHAGGIKASSKYVFGRTGRPLNAKEKAMNKGEIVLARIPIAFATGSNTKITKLNISQIEDLYSGKITDWGDLGGTAGAVVLVGREPTEAVFSVLKGVKPRFKDSKFDKVFNKDHQVVTFLKSPDGANAVAFGALPNFGDVNVIKVEDFSAGVAVGLVFDLKNKAHPLVKAARTFAATPVWRDTVNQAGLLPPE